jgi:hypothetical protein
VNIPYECQLRHDGQLVTVTLPILAVPKCGKCGELVFDYEADDQINAAFEGRKRELEIQATGGVKSRS